MWRGSKPAESGSAQIARQASQSAGPKGSTHANDEVKKKMVVKPSYLLVFQSL
jgi:hypothetical protein